MKPTWMWSLAVCFPLLACGTTGGSDAGVDGGAGGGAGGNSGCDGPAKSPPNLISNSGFECGDMGWAPQTGTLEVVSDARTGAKAVKLTASASGDGTFAVPTPFLSNAPSDNYCATAWVKGTVSNARLSLLTNKNGAGTDTNFSIPVASTSWLRIPPSKPLAVPGTMGMNLYLRLVMSQASAGDTLIVDDVDVWESTDGKCNEAR